MTYTITRPLMTAAELRQHQAGQHGRDYAESDDGWGDMEAEERRGWRAIASWGRDGWDLGDWPYVAIYARTSNPGTTTGGTLDRAYELMQVVEGDRTAWTFTTAADRDAATDYLFLWYAAGRSWAPLSEEDRPRLDAGELTVEEKFRGPYREEKVTTMTAMTVQQLADLILEQTRARLAAEYSDEQASWEQVRVVPGPKYTKIDRGPEHNMSGYLMIENATGDIYGIRGYGRVHKARWYGNLDTAGELYWGEYSPMDPAEYARYQAAQAGRAWRAALRRHQAGHAGIMSDCTDRACQDACRTWAASRQEGHHG